jgi:acetylornithine deacetylase/succinyl-diaminopimelate desuccinylase-like protein
VTPVDTSIPAQLARALAHLDGDRTAALARLFALMRIASVSMDPAADGFCDAAATWCADDLRAIGFTTSVYPTSAHAMVIGHRASPVPGARHVLFYGHYDVQPADPIGLWSTPPFEPAIIAHPIHGAVIAGRGACDDKGQLMTFIEAVRAWLATNGELPLSVTVLLEGDEEADSAHLADFLTAHADALRADCVLVCDSDALDAKTPAITTSLRGYVGGEINIRGADRDLHCGDFGGIAPNPAMVLARLLAGLHDADGRVTLPGFYDGIADVSPGQRDAWQRLGFDPDAFLGNVGLRTPAGERGRAVLEQVWTRPTAEVNGIWGGYCGPGGKSIIPAKASAKITFRLVPGQDPTRVMDRLEAYCHQGLPPDCTLTLMRWDGSPATLVDPALPQVQQAARALADEWGVQPAIIGSGGSIPIVSNFKRQLGMDTLLIGFALDDDNVHAPNEKYNVASFERGCRSWVRILAALAEPVRSPA